MADKKLNVKVSTTGAGKSKKEIGGLNGAISKMGKAVGIASAAYFGARGLISGFSSVIRLAGIQEQAEKKLATALGHTSKSLLNHASALQKMTTFGDEAIIGVQASLAAFIKDEEQIKKATVAVLDISVAMGMDLKAAGDLVAKTLGSSMNAMSRYGVVVEGAVGSTERLESLTNNVATLFGGQASAQADTMAGSMEQMHNAIGDTGEAIGNVLSPLIIELAGRFKSAAISASDFIAIPISEKLMKEQIEYNALIGMLKDATTSQDGRNTAVATLQKNYPNYIGNIDLESASIDQLNGLLKESNATFEEKIKLQASEEILAEASRDATAAKIDATKAEIKYNKLLQDGTRIRMVDLDGLVEYKSKAELFVDQKNRLVRIAGKEAEKYAELRKSIGDLGIDYDKTGTAIENFGKKAKGTFDKLTKGVVVLTDAQRANLESEWHTQYKQAVEGTYGLELEAIDTTMARYGQVETDKTKLTEVESSLRQKLHMKTAKMVASSFASNMQTMADAGMVGQTTAKRFAQVQALVDAYASANASYKAMAGIPVVGPALGIAAAAAALGAGLANVSMIEKAETGFDGVVNKPTMFMTGEAGPERVSVLPLTPGMNQNGPSGSINISINGGIVDESYVRNELIPALNRATSLGATLA